MRIAVVGLGSAGSMALWQLSQVPGVEAVGYEQFGIGHAHGSFSGESRLFRTAYHEGAKYVPLLMRARELWAELGAASGRELFRNTGVLSVGRETDATFQRLIDSVERHDLPHERLDVARLRADYPALDFADDEAGLIDALGGALTPEMAVLSAIEQARLHGAVTHEHEPITAIEPRDSGVRITAKSGTADFDRVIVTAGSWADHLNPELAELTEVRKIVLTWFVPQDAAQFAVGTMPCFIRDRGDFHVFGAPMLDGYSIKISSDVGGVMTEDRPEQINLRIDSNELSAFGAQVQQLFPSIWPEPVRYSVHHDSYTADKTPIFDRRGDVVTVAGLSGHGFKLAPAYGELAAQLAVRGEGALWHPDFAMAAHGPVHAAE